MNKSNVYILYIYLIYKTYFSSILSKDLFYLDLSVEFNLGSIDDLPWIDLTNQSGIPVKSSWSTVSLGGGKFDPTFYLIGGMMKDLKTNENVNDTIIYAYDLKTKQWSRPELTVIDKDRDEIELTKESTLQQQDYIKRVIGSQSVNDELGKIYIWWNGVSFCRF